LEEFAPYEDLVPPIVLRARGKDYTLPTVNWEQGVALLQKITAGPVTVAEITEELLGTELIEQLANDGAPFEFVALAGQVAFADWKFGRETARAVYRDPKLLETLTKSLEAAPPPATTTAEASTTPRPASTSGTRPRPKKRKRNPSHGRTS
jgi:hypothetical protein